MSELAHGARVRTFGIIGLVSALPVVFVLGAYGTLSPCGMLKKDLQASALKTMAARDASGFAGAALAAAFTGPVIDGFVGAMSPLECMRALARLHIEGNGPLGAPSVAAAARSSAPIVKPPLDWKKELKIHGDSWSNSYGHMTFKGEIENAGTHVIRELTVYVWMYDADGREIGTAKDSVIYGFSDPLRPGHRRPFSVMARASTELRSIKYSVGIGEYDTR